MRKPKSNHTREQRISDEIVVDAYGPEERAMGWYYYLEQKLAFPFKAQCVVARRLSPLRMGQKVHAVGMAREEECESDMFVLIRFARRKLGVPLSQLEVIDGNSETCEAVEDWRYWKAMGYEF